MPEEVPEQLPSCGTSVPEEGGHLFLTGFMGSGKTEIGQRLAAALERPFVDLDQEIEDRSGLTIPEIFRQAGEAGFRQVEEAALADLVSPGKPAAAVVATGGGIVLRDANRQRMRASGRIVWLNPSFETLLARLPPEARQGRPLFADESRARALWMERRPLYRQCDLELVVGPDESPRQTTSRILNWLMETV